MQIGIPKEIKNNEHRVGLTPDSVSKLIANKHSVFVEHNAGKEIGFSDEDYSSAGASILETPKEGDDGKPDPQNDIRNLKLLRRLEG